MSCYRAAILLTVVAIAAPAVAQQPPGRDVRGPSDRSYSSSSAERWVQQLANDLDHLQEDLYFERGTYPEALRNQVDRASHAVAHFQHVLRDSKDEQHLRRDFQEMDKAVHEVVKSLSESKDSWLRRQATRIVYADEQLHYTLKRKLNDPPESRRELIARQAHVLEREARDLEALAERVNRRDRQLRDAIHSFVERAEHFHHAAEERGDSGRLRKEFRELDEAWHHVVERLNGSSYVFYLRTAARDVNRVHNQIHELVNVDHERPVAVTPVPPQPAPPQPPRRPAIEFEIPGVGRFQIPQ